MYPARPPGPGGGPLVAACGGRLVIALHTPGATLDIDHAYLTPGAWLGRSGYCPPRHPTRSNPRFWS